MLMVVRTFPIRVAGNSGYIANETTWEEVSKLAGRPVTEKTTVTHKTRRVAFWDDAVFETACLLNEPTEIALTFADYIDPDLADVSGNVPSVEALQSSKLSTFIDNCSSKLKEKLRYISTGADSIIDVNKPEVQDDGE